MAIVLLGWTLFWNFVTLEISESIKFLKSVPAHGHDPLIPVRQPGGMVLVSGPLGQIIPGVDDPHAVEDMAGRFE